MGRDLRERGSGRYAGIASAVRVAAGDCGRDDHRARIPVDVAIAGDPDTAALRHMAFVALALFRPVTRESHPRFTILSTPWLLIEGRFKMSME
jgi:hypothetical protein